MRILHTADWHIGQLFHEYDRTYEHQQFLDWLVKTLQEEKIDVLLISGDVFDLSNPSAASIKMFYTFLNKAVKANPDLQIIITAGNHDSASRLESPKPLLESSNIHIIGTVEKDENQQINYDKLIIPVKDEKGVIKALCLAVPFLRVGDYPTISNCENPYTEGVSSFYQQAYTRALGQTAERLPIIAMGHLHAQQAEITDLDNTERLIMGGVECISASAFHPELKYVALGHIHKAQRIGGKEHIRYSGSPIPMSFSELNYKHQVIVFNLEEKGIESLKSIEIPESVSLLRIPTVNQSMSDVLNQLEKLPATDGNTAYAPYLEVRILLDAPEPALRHKVETALVGKHVRLAKIDVKYPKVDSAGNTSLTSSSELRELKPLDIFSQVYQSTYNNPVPESIKKLFNEVAQEISQQEN